MPISLIPNNKKKGMAPEALTEAKSYALDFLPAMAVLGLVLVVYIATSVWLSSLRTEYEEIQSRKDSLSASVRRAQTGDLQFFVSRARALKGVIDDHVQVSQVFTPFEESVHPQVVVASIQLNADNGELVVAGETSGFEALGEQYMIWKDETLFFNDVDLSSFERTEEGVVTFTMNFQVKEDYLR